MGSARGRRKPARLIGGVAAVTVLTLVLAACSQGTSSPVVATATVERTTIRVGVSGVGSLAASSTRNLGFPSGGQLTSIDAQVGDKVTAGQVLARVDDFMLRQLLVQQQANLSSQQAALARLQHSPLVKGARNTLSQARTILSATKSQAAATGRADDVAITRANAGLDAAKAAQSAAEAALAACTSDCSTLAAAVASAKAGVVTATTGVATAEQKQNVDAAAGRTSVAAAQQSVVGAQNSASSAASDRPYNIAQQRAAVTTARSLVAIARHNLTLATLKAPFDGTVTAINGTVGEYLTASTGTTAEAPGADAAVPGTTLNSAASAIARPGGTQFMVISATGPLSAVVPFQELDAAGVITGQRVDLTLDALPDVTVTGTVKAVSPSATVLSGSNSYFATVRLTSTDERLKEGMSVHATVVTAEHQQVLSVPNSAVHTADGHTAVTLVDASGAQRSVPFDAGLVGPDRTEVLSGLVEGDRVAVPDAGK